MLQLKEVEAHYGLARALSGINLTVPEGKMVGLIGPNGAGKTTTILTICGLHPVSAGSIFFDSSEIAGLPPQDVKQLGIATVPEGRRLFTKMTVLDNLLMGAYLTKDRKQIKKTMSEVFSLFPVLGERKKQLAGTLSGGEQQMLAIGRALMATPSMMLADEMSLGLAPLIIREIYRVIKSINDTRGVSVLVVEQQAVVAFKYTSYLYIMELGKIVMEGDPSTLIKNDYVQKTYLGE
jgi:branched-chain amino acid transport system ATP-binding protein